MFVFVVWQINSPSLWIRSLPCDVWQWRLFSIRCLKYVRSPQSEVWKLMSKVHNLKSDVRSLTKSVWFMSKVWSAMYVCSKPEVQKPKSEVQSMSKVQNLSLKPKSEGRLSVVQVWKRSPESNEQNLKLKVWSRKSIWGLFKVFCNYYNFVIQYRYYILCVCRLITTIAGQLYR